MSDMTVWSAAYDLRPTDPLCEAECDIIIVSKRCVYVNNYRVAGSKPYVSENLPTRSMKTKVRTVLDAFSEREIVAYLAEKRGRAAYLEGVRNYQNASEAHD